MYNTKQQKINADTVEGIATSKVRKLDTAATTEVLFICTFYFPVSAKVMDTMITLGYHPISINC